MQGYINGRLNRLLKSYMSPINGKISLKKKALLPLHTRLYVSKTSGVQFSGKYN